MIRKGTEYAVLGLLITGCAVQQHVVGIDRDPPSDCQSLGEVLGKDWGENANKDWAKRRAWNKAEALGATHVREVSAMRGFLDDKEPGVMVAVYKGTAYRCPEGAIATQAK